MIDNTKQINQDMFRYNLVKDRYNIELEQLKDIDNASRMLYNTSIAVLTIEITLLSGFIIQNMQKIREINPSLTYLVIIFMIITMLFTLRSITYFSNAKKINEQVAPIEWADIEQL